MRQTDSQPAVSVTRPPECRDFLWTSVAQYSEAERVGGFEVNDQLKLGRLHDRQVPQVSRR